MPMILESIAAKSLIAEVQLTEEIKSKKFG
jgi:hypothetical protein